MVKQEDFCALFLAVNNVSYAWIKCSHVVNNINIVLFQFICNNKLSLKRFLNKNKNQAWKMDRSACGVCGNIVPKKRLIK